MRVPPFLPTDTSLSGIQEWLGTVAEKLSLKIDLQRSQQLPGTSVFLIHEGFYIEVCFQDNDTLSSVKLSQANTTQVGGGRCVKLHPLILSFRCSSGGVP